MRQCVELNNGLEFYVTKMIRVAMLVNIYRGMEFWCQVKAYEIESTTLATEQYAIIGASVT